MCAGRKCTERPFHISEQQPHSRDQARFSVHIELGERPAKIVRFYCQDASGGAPPRELLSTVDVVAVGRNCTALAGQCFVNSLCRIGACCSSKLIASPAILGVPQTGRFSEHYL